MMVTWIDLLGLFLRCSLLSIVELFYFLIVDMLKTMKFQQTYAESLSHLIKAAIGTGILSMPLAFKNSGIILGICCTIFTGLITGHCCYILVKCAHKLYLETQRTEMTYLEVIESALLTGPEKLRAYASKVKQFAQIGLFFTYFGVTSVFNVIAAVNFEQVISHYYGYKINVRLVILALWIPVVLLVWIPNLKALAVISTIANILTVICLGIVLKYLIDDLPPITDRDYINLETLPGFFSITIFAMATIGVIMPLENNMAKPYDLLGECGVISHGMLIITIIYGVLGFVGYLKYGEQTEDSITLNFPVEDGLAQYVKILVGVSIFFTIGLQFYVCQEIIWNQIHHRFTKHPLIANYTVRTLLSSCTILLAVTCPTIGPFMSLIGAFFFSTLGIILPALLELIVFWKEDNGLLAFLYLLLKDIVISLFGIFALILGTYYAVLDIIEFYSRQ